MGTAGAHTCAQSSLDLLDHSACDGHSCPAESAPHNHTTGHASGLLVHACAATSLPEALSVACDYVSGSGDLVIAENGVGGCRQTNVTVGLTLTVTIADDVRGPTSGLVRNSMTYSFCGSITFETVTSVVEVFVDGPVFGSPVLSPCGALSTGTTGTITMETP